MFCSKCGANIPDNSPFCPNCGATIASANTEEAQYNAAYSNYANNNYNNAPQLPMKWYKALAYVLLWLSALMNLINGITILTGGQYEGYKELVYSYYPAMKPVDLFFGLAVIAVALLGAYTAYSLIKFKKIAPKLVLVLYASNVVITILYIAIASSIAGQSLLTSNSIITIVVGIVMVFVNKAYFDKRAHLFVN